MAKRVIWLPTGPRSKSSSRIQVYNIHDKLLSLGYDSQLLYEPKRTIWNLPLSGSDIPRLNLNSDDLIIIQKFKTRSTIDYIKRLRAEGARIGYIDCDEPIAPTIARLVDFVIVPSVFLQKRYEDHGVKCFCIQDCPEIFISPEEREYPKREQLKCVWFGNHSRSKWKEVTYFRDFLKKKGINWQLETISNTYRATHRWGKDSFLKLTTYDLVVIPVPQMNLDYKGKSANRLLQSMALGLPVLASPIPSYLDIANQHQLVDLICNAENDWVNRLEFYSNYENRISSINRNYAIAKSYALENVIKEWIDTFQLDIPVTINKLDVNLLEKIKRKSLFRGYEIKFA